MTASLDTRKFDEAMRFYASAVKKDTAHIVNRQALNVLLKTVKLTPKADPKAIKGKLLRPDGKPNARVYKIISMQDAGGAFAEANARKTSKGRRSAKLKVAKAFVGRRVRATGYIRAGWFTATSVLDRLLGKNVSLGSGAGIRKKFPNLTGHILTAKASEKPFAEFGSMAKAAGRIGRAALQRGMDAAAADMRQYAEKVMKQTARKVAIVK
jgi:hypothetical protein